VSQKSDSRGAAHLAIRTLDLCGEVCPYTFVRTKLLLEEMADGEELEILLDHRAAFTNVPRALVSDGHEVLHVEISTDGKAASVHARKGRAPK
jgi:tRNA 2-thiouridine synthesizing protein A